MIREDEQKIISTDYGNYEIVNLHNKRAYNFARMKLGSRNQERRK